MMIDPITTLNIMINGMLIGIIASAPMGPVGVLTVRRTLNKGLWFGFATGVGAALSDLIYATITLWGMSMVLEWVEKPSTLFYLNWAEASCCSSSDGTPSVPSPHRFQQERTVEV